MAITVPLWAAALAQVWSTMDLALRSGRLEVRAAALRLLLLLLLFVSVGVSGVVCAGGDVDEEMPTLLHDLSQHRHKRSADVLHT